MESQRQALLRRIPSVDTILATAESRRAVERHGRGQALAEVRRQLDRLREAVLAGSAGTPEALDAVAAALPAAVASALDRREAGRLVEVVNATGVLVHTNLGRAPLGRAAVDRLAERAGGSVDLELDLASGKRGQRAPGCDELLVELTGAEAACVVNNNAAALLLALDTLAGGRDVVVSRGELVEIGGSFRIPDVCAKARGRMVEVGTTNRTRLSDYAAACGPGAGVLLKVHPSNFRVVGFTEQASVAELVALGRERGIPVVMDQGSGVLSDLAPWGIEGETPVPELVAEGADVVLFSGDKLLGGPQAGCIVGRRDAVNACRANPLYRALRPGRLTLLALEATLWAHATGRLDDVPVLAQLKLPPEAVRERAERLRERLATHGSDGVRLVVEAGDSTSGGGSSPLAKIPTFVLSVGGPSVRAEALAAALRRGRPPVMTRIERDSVVLDLRTVPADRDDAVATALATALDACRTSGEGDVTS